MTLRRSAQVGDPGCLGANRRLLAEGVEAVIKPLRIKPEFHSKMREVPQAMAGQFGGRLAAEVGPDGHVLPLNPTYQVSAVLPERDDWLPNGAIGQARIHVGRRTVGWRLWRWSMRTFHFEL